MGGGRKKGRALKTWVIKTYFYEMSCRTAVIFCHFFHPKKELISLFGSVMFLIFTFLLSLAFSSDLVSCISFLFVLLTWSLQLLYLQFYWTQSSLWLLLSWLEYNGCFAKLEEAVMAYL